MLDRYIVPAELIGIRHLSKSSEPDEGQHVIWIWAAAGQLTAGDYSQGVCRDAARSYEIIRDTQPSHWMPWPNNWPE